MANIHSQDLVYTFTGSGFSSLTLLSRKCASLNGVNGSRESLAGDMWRS